MYKIFFGFFFGFAKISSTFAPSKGTLSYGVMVTQQILVLLFQVRILVAQQERMVKGHPFFCCREVRLLLQLLREPWAFFVSGSKPLLLKGGVGRDFKYVATAGHPLLFAKGFARALGDWLLREPCFLCQVVSPSFSKEGLGRIVGIREGRRPSLSLRKGFAGRPLEVV